MNLNYNPCKIKFSSSSSSSRYYPLSIEVRPRSRYIISDRLGVPNITCTTDVELDMCVHCPPAADGVTDLYTSRRRRRKRERELTRTRKL